MHPALPDQPARPRSAATPMGPPREDAWNRALHATATALIFERRAKVLKRKLRFLSFAGLAVPVIIGGLALSYGIGFKALPVLIIIGSVVGITQAVVSLWSLTSGWVEGYDASIQAIITNRRLAQSYEELARSQALNEGNYSLRFEALRAADDVQRAADYRQGIAEDEKRFGMRGALIRYRRGCAACNIQPVNMKPTECGVCGDFSKRKFRPGK
jgi:mobilome CxxCx(11)CxxC protein